MNTIKKCVIFGLLLALASNLFAYIPPTIQCIKLLNNNTRIHIDWENSTDCAQFEKYVFVVNGERYDSVTVSPPNSLCSQGGIDIDNITASNQYECYIEAVDQSNNTWISDTIRSFTLNITTNSTRTQATLSWEMPTTSLNNTWGTTFDLYKKRGFEPNFPTQPFESVPVSQLTYTDPSDVCNEAISYQVGIRHYYMDGTNQTNCPFMTPIITVENMKDTVQPAPPVLDSVTVTPDNKVMLGFHETEPFMKAFFIYFIDHDNNDITRKLDSVFGGQTYWIDPDVDANNNYRDYRISVKDSCCPKESILTDNPQCNMMLKLKSTDACRKSAFIQWSTYVNLIDGINHYVIMLSDDDGTTWDSVGETTANNYEIQNLVSNQNYKAYVRVVNNGATVTASSNRVQFNIPPAASEDFSYISSVSVIENRHIQVNALTSGDTLPFVSITLQRSEDGINFEDFTTVSHQQGTATYVFYDSVADFKRKTYFYRTFILNKCDTKTGYSNISHNILLHGENNAQTNILSWSGYDNWDGDVSDYFVMRKMENEELFNTIDNLAPTFSNNYQDDISQLFESGSKFVYYVEAKENLNRYGIEATSYSNHVTVLQPPTLYFPNAFRPTGATNNIFKPNNSFVSAEHYLFSIYTRTGERIFFTTDPQEGWNGRINGVLAPMNVYVYYIEYQLPDGTIMNRTGTVTLLR